MSAPGHSTHFATCSLCEATCGIVIDVEGGQVTTIRGDADDSFSQGHICPKVMGLKDIHEDPDRLRQPLRRTESGWEPMDWDEAFDYVADRLVRIQQAHGTDAVAIYQGNPTAHNMGLLTYGQVFLRRLGTRNTYSATSADQLPHMLAALTMFGHQLMLPVPDIDRTHHMLMLGANPVVSGGSLMTAPGFKRRIKELRERGGTLTVIDPRRTETARLADTHLFIRPGTDALLLLALLHCIYDEKLATPGPLSSFLSDEDTLRRMVAGFAPESVAAATGLTADAIRTLARDFCAAKSAVCYGRLGVCTQEFGALAAWLVNVINIVTGNFDRPGGAMFATPAFDLVRGATMLGHRGGFDRWRSRVSGRPEFGGELPVSVLAEEIETPGRGQIRALITSAGNPVLSTPNGRRLDDALESLDFMVSIDFYLNETTRHADIILPPTFTLERDHYDLAFALLSVRNVAKYAKPVFEREEDQRHDWEIVLELATRMEASRSFVGRSVVGRGLAGLARRTLGRLGPRALLDAGLRLGPYGRSDRKLTLGVLERSPHGVDLGPLQSQLPRALHTADKRIHLVPEIYQRDMDRLRTMQTTPHAVSDLLLIGRRHLRSNNSWMHNSKRLVKGAPRCTLLIHPDDALQLGIDDGDLVAISSRVGAVRAPAEISDEMMRGVVSLPHGWGHDRPGTRLSVAEKHPGVSLNDLTDEQFLDGLSGTCGFSGVRVQVAVAATPYDLIGPDKLREVITDFYDRLFSDLMIGFLFQGKPKQQLIEREWQFTANFLGGNVPYEGRTIRKAHARSPILGGHFERRLQILRETMNAHQVPAAVQEPWIAHTQALRAQVTADKGAACDHALSEARVQARTDKPSGSGEH